MPFLTGFTLAPIVRFNGGHPFNLLAGADVNGDRHSTNDRAIGAGRNTGRGPNYADFDLRLSRIIKLSEKAELQLVAEGFNLLNRTNFASVNNVVGPGFGLPLTAGGAGATTFNVPEARNPAGVTRKFLAAPGRFNACSLCISVRVCESGSHLTSITIPRGVFVC
jgi:hypothetical protein